MQTKLTIGLDVDDVLFELMSSAIAIANRTPGVSIRYEEIDWGFDNLPEKAHKAMIDAINNEDLYLKQEPFPGAVLMVNELLDMGHDIVFTSAVAPQFMSARSKRLMEVFPRVPPRNIILGQRKDLMCLDVLLDDAMHNVLGTRAKYPVLFRRPWNRVMDGLLSVSSYPEFIALVRLFSKWLSGAKTNEATYGFNAFGSASKMQAV